MPEIQEENNIIENQSTKEWLAIKLDMEKRRKVDIYEVEELYKTSLGLDFLLVWTIFEKTFFSDSPKRGDKISKVTKNLKFCLTSDMESILKYFLERYKKDRKKLRQLCDKDKCKGKCYGDSGCNFFNYIERDSVTYTNEEKLYILMYVVNRYRNNMFHGTKKVKSWLSDYKFEIENCVSIMKWLVDELEKIRNE